MACVLDKPHLLLMQINWPSRWGLTKYTSTLECLFCHKLRMFYCHVLLGWYVRRVVASIQAKQTIAVNEIWQKTNYSPWANLYRNWSIWQPSNCCSVIFTLSSGVWEDLRRGLPLVEGPDTYCHLDRSHNSLIITDTLNWLKYRHKFEALILSLHFCLHYCVCVCWCAPR